VLQLWSTALAVHVGATLIGWHFSRKLLKREYPTYVSTIHHKRTRISVSQKIKTNCKTPHALLLKAKKTAALSKTQTSGSVLTSRS
jgi:hypothetical protein